MAHYSETLRNEQTQAPIAGAYVSVIVNGTGEAATLTDALSNPIDNPLVTPADGAIEFYASDGLYDLEYRVGGRKVGEDRFIQIGAPPPLPASILTALATTGGAALVGEASGGTVQSKLNSLATYTQSGTGAVGTTVQARLRRSVYVDDFGAIGDGLPHALSTRFGSLGAAQAVYPFVTSLTQLIDWAAITAAINERVSRGGGEVRFTAGKHYYCGETIQAKRTVDLIGEGSDSTTIQVINDHAITFAFSQGIGNSRIMDLAFLGQVGSTKTCIYQAIPTTEAFELDGMELRNLQIRYFDTAIQLNTARNVLIDNVTGLNLNNGINFAGLVLETQLRNVRMVYGGGPGGGTVGTAYYFGNRTYSGTANQLRVEGLKIDSPYIYGFNRGIDLSDVLLASVENVDITVIGEAIRWATALGELKIGGGRIELREATASVGIRGVGISASTDSKVNIRGVEIINPDGLSSSTIGILIGTAGDVGNQNNVTIEDCLFTGMKLGDIVSYLSGGHRIVGNKCYSTAPTNSILLGNVPAGRPCYIDQNECKKEIASDAAALRSGDVQIGSNYKNGNTYFDGSKIVGTITYDPPSLADGAGDTSAAVTVTGAAFGDAVIVSAPYDLQGIIATAYVSAANAAKIRLQNETGGTIDLASGTWRVTVRRSL